MLPDSYSLISYHPSKYPNDYALLGKKYRSNISGRGTIVFSIKGQLVLVRKDFHATSLRAPLYSTQHHCTQPGCAYYNANTVDNLLLFPTMSIDMDSSTDNTVRFLPIGCTLRNRKLYYVEPHTYSDRPTNNPLYLESVYILVPTKPTSKHPTHAP